MKSKGSEPVSHSAIAIALVSVVFGLFFCSYSFYLHTELPAAKSLKCPQPNKSDSLPSFESLKSETETTKDNYYKCYSDLQTARQMTGDQENEIKDLKALTEAQDNRKKDLQTKINTKKNQGLKACGKEFDTVTTPSIVDKVKKKILELHPDLGLYASLSEACTLEDGRVVALLHPEDSYLAVILFDEDGNFIAETKKDAFRCYFFNGGFWSSLTDIEDQSRLSLECHGGDEGSGYEMYYTIDLGAAKNGAFDKVVETESCDTQVTFQ